MATEIAAESRRGRLLFPLKPFKHESFQGYVVRVAEWNTFRKPTVLLKALGLNPSPGEAWNRRALRKNDELVRRLGISMSDAEDMLLWSDPLGLDYNLRTTSVRRVSPKGLRKAAFHREYWGTAQLDYCPETWDYLLSRCPRCESSLEWDVARVDYCSVCMFDLKLATVPSVPIHWRPLLRGVASLISRDRRRREAAKLQAPPEFQSYSPFMIFDLAALFGCAVDAERVAGFPSRTRLYDQKYEASQLLDGAKVLARYPEMFRKFSEASWNSVKPSFFTHLSNFRRIGVMNIPLYDLLIRWEPVTHGPSRLKRKREEQGQWTLRETARYLGIQNIQVRKLINKNLLSVSSSRGESRIHQWIDPGEAERVRGIIAERISLDGLSKVLSLPESAIEQIVHVGLLSQNQSPIAKVLYPECSYHWVDVGELLRRLELNLCDPAATSLKMVTLEELFYGVGAQPKPWAAFLLAILEGRIPAYFGNPCPGRIQIKNLRFTEEFAREVVCRKRPELLSVPEVASTEVLAGSYSRVDVEAYLNCYPRDLTWLRTRGHFSNERKGFSRSEVEALGRELISSREIMWRWRVSPELREGLATEHGIRRIKGPFWPREAVEGHFSKLFGSAGGSSS